MQEIGIVSIQWLLVLLGFIILYYSLKTFIFKPYSFNNYQKRHINNAVNGSIYNPDLVMSSESIEGITAPIKKIYRKNIFFGLIPWKKGLSVYSIQAQARLNNHGWE